jgi:iron complex outermembrane receptor protein
MKNETVVGFDVNHIDFRHTNNSPYSGTSLVDPYSFDPGNFQNVAGTFPKYDTESFQCAFFVEDRLEVSKKLSLVAGVRLDRPTVERRNLVTGVDEFEKDF